MQLVVGFGGSFAFGLLLGFYGLVVREGFLFLGFYLLLGCYLVGLLFDGLWGCCCGLVGWFLLVVLSLFGVCCFIVLLVG